MYWEKEIRFRLTTRRIFGAILAAMSAMNLIIVGAVFEAASSATPTLTPLSITQVQTLTFPVPTSTVEETFVSTLASTESATQTISATFTDTVIPTATSTSPPIPTLCTVRSYGSIYYVQRGDTLYALAHLTGSTVEELMLANCLTDTRILTGQLLYMPRLPVVTLMPTSTYTPTGTPYIPPTFIPTATLTDTPIITPIYEPTIFQNPSGNISLCYDPYYIYFSVLPLDSQAIRSVTVFYSFNNGPWNEISMGPDGATYYGSGTITGKYAQAEMDYYYFRAIDSLGNITNSDKFSITFISCQ